MGRKLLMKGNEALAEAAVRAGLQAVLRLSDHPANRAVGIYGKKYAQERRAFVTGRK